MRPAALVTGGAVRLGRHIALHLAAQGYDIALHYHTSKEQAQQTVRDIEAQGAACQLFAADLSQPASYQKLIESASSAFPALEVLVNNASVFDRGSLLDSDAALFEKEHRINLQAPVFLTQAFAKQQKKGCVVNMVDAAVSRNQHAYFFYLMSKKSLLEFTRMAAADLGPDIRVNAVCPGVVLLPPDYDASFKDKMAKKLPMQRTPEPEEVAAAVGLLAENATLTGQVIYVDGGESLLCG